VLVGEDVDAVELLGTVETRVARPDERRRLTIAVLHGVVAGNRRLPDRVEPGEDPGRHRRGVVHARGAPSARPGGLPPRGRTRQTTLHWRPTVSGWWNV